MYSIVIHKLRESWKSSHFESTREDLLNLLPKIIDEIDSSQLSPKRQKMDGRKKSIWKYFLFMKNKIFMLKYWTVLGLFFFILSFRSSWQYIVKIKFVDDWIRTADFWSQKWHLYQPSHCRCQQNINVNVWPEQISIIHWKT